MQSSNCSLQREGQRNSFVERNVTNLPLIYSALNLGTQISKLTLALHLRLPNHKPLPPPKRVSCCVYTGVSETTRSPTLSGLHRPQLQ